MNSVSEPLQRTALMRHLQYLDEPVLYGKLVSLRDQISEWLGYIPATFPHYTRHAVGHSDEVVRQISFLLFEDQDWRRPTLELSASEIYGMVSAAYLHDAGMVASERDKAEILISSAWKEWITSGGGARRWSEINELRLRAGVNDSSQHFLADLQTRFLIAEYIRRQHHIRAASFLEESNELFTAHYFQDPAMLRTVADICIGHGLDWRELENPERYPLRRDVSHGPVNVRLLAVLLRLGDLLDLAYDRACPLLLNAAAPLPYDSLANWSQYRRIVHRLTDPKRIEITAECANQDEHRLLRDWCQWIQDETEHAAVLIQGPNRHGTWQPPKARLYPPDVTISIRPRTDASYIPVDWIFELDENTVFERLIVDAYEGPLDAVRELLQNAADANRCALAQFLRVRGIEYSGWVEESEAALLEALPIHVTISEVSRPNDLSGEPEIKTIIKVEDVGIGMDSDVIQRYLLQVGRSYYSSRDFQRDFGFIPTSRFGIGFLSVFSVSDRVEVDTYKPSAASGPLKLRLTGPKSYVLLDQGSRNTQGTSVSLELRESITATTLVKAVRDWCRRLEFPVIVQSLSDGNRSVIVAERPIDQNTYKFALKDCRAVRFRAIPIKTSAARGELYVLEVLDENDEWRWDTEFRSIERRIREYDPLAPFPLEDIKPLLCLHGISIPLITARYSMRLRLDYRKSRGGLQVGLGRSSWGRDDFPPADKEIDEALIQIWAEHCNDRAADWLYRHRAAHALDLPERILHNLPDTMRAFDHAGQPVFRSIREIYNTPNLIMVSTIDKEDSEIMADGRLNLLLPDVDKDSVYILGSDVQNWNYGTREEVSVESRRFRGFRFFQEANFEYLELDSDNSQGGYFAQVLLIDLESAFDEVLLFISYNHSLSTRRVVVNSRNSVVRELNQTLHGNWEVGEVRLLGGTGSVNDEHTDDFSKVIQLIVRSSTGSNYFDSAQVPPVLESLANSGKIPRAIFEGLTFKWNRFGALISQ